MKRKLLFPVLGGFVAAISALASPSVSAATRITCFTAASTQNPFDVPFFSITQPEQGLAVLNLNGGNILAYMKKRADLNPGTIELDEKIVSISKYPIPCRHNGDNREAVPRFTCHFSDRYSVSLSSYEYEGRMVTVSDFTITEPQYGEAFSWGPRLYCKDDH